MRSFANLWLYFRSIGKGIPTEIGVDTIPYGFDHGTASDRVRGNVDSLPRSRPYLRLGPAETLHGCDARRGTHAACDICSSFCSHVIESANASSWCRFMSARGDTTPAYACHDFLLMLTIEKRAVLFDTGHADVCQ